MVHDLGIILITAGVTSLVCKLLRQPVVLGYIIAGLLVGPYVCGSSWIDDIDSVRTWGEVGVIFLLFSMGLEFSFKKLFAMGATAFVACMTIVAGMMTMGFLVGLSLGWGVITSLLLGGMLCMSSTTIVFKALDDLGLRQQKFAGICFSILVVEDLFAVVLMVVLASLAVRQSFDGLVLGRQLLKLGGYLVLWFVLGILLIPTFFRYMRKQLNAETMTIVSLALCLGMVLLAEGAGFSAALGAFVMGSMLAETLEAERIEQLVSPIKNMFGAVFFVSVGMMIAPSQILHYWLPIGLITLVVILGQMVFATLGVVLSGQPLKTAMQSAFALTQVGEFAFIIANFGVEKGLTEPFIGSVVVAVSVVTTFLTPYTIRLAEPAYRWVEPHLPESWRQRIAEHSAQGMRLRPENGFWQTVRQLLQPLAEVSGFSRNLNERDQMLEGKRAVHRDLEAQLLVYDLHIADFELPLNSSYCGKKLSETNWRTETGLTVVRIMRGHVKLNIPNRNERVYANDRIVVVGTDQQIQAFARLLEHSVTMDEAESWTKAGIGRTSTIKLKHMCVMPYMDCCGKTLAESRLAETTGCAVVGIDYGDEILVTPRASSVLSEGAMVVLAGE